MSDKPTRKPVPLEGRLLPPNRDRHRIQHVRQRTPTRSNVNSVVEPWVDMVAETDAIARGEASRNGDEYTINGRLYRIKTVNTGKRLYPIDGPGVHQLSRIEFKALGVYNDLGVTPRVEMIITKMGVTIAEQRRVRALWEIGKDISNDVDRN